MKMFKGDLFAVLSELGASSDALTVAEELLKFHLVSASSHFVGWRTDKGRLEVVYIGDLGALNAKRNKTLRPTRPESVMKSAQPISSKARAVDNIRADLEPLDAAQAAFGNPDPDNDHPEYWVDPRA